MHERAQDLRIGHGQALGHRRRRHRLAAERGQQCIDLRLLRGRERDPVRGPGQELPRLHQVSLCRCSGGQLIEQLCRPLIPALDATLELFAAHPGSQRILRMVVRQAFRHARGQGVPATLRNDRRHALCIGRLDGTQGNQFAVGKHFG